MMRRVPLLRDGIVDTVIWAVQEETDVGIVRFEIELGPGLFGASQILCVAAGYMLDIGIVTEQVARAEAERKISAAVVSVAGSDEHTTAHQSLLRLSSAVLCLTLHFK